MRATFFTIFITLIHKAGSGPTPDNDVTLRVQDSCKSDGSSSCGSDQWNGSELSDMNAGSEVCGFLFTQWNEESAPCSAASEGPWGHSPYALIGQLSKMVFGRSHQRPPRHTLPQIVSTDKSSAFDVQFQKCAEIITESEVPQIKLYLVVKIPEDGNDLSQLTIHDTIADIISLETNGHIEGNVYQVFSKDTLPAGSSYVAMYNASVKGSWNEVLFLPAFLNFSNESQNDINLFGPAVFGPLVANFTLRIDTTEKVCVDHALHFAWFCVAFLISTLLLSLTLLTSACCYIYCCTHTPKHTMQRRQRRSFSREAEPDEAFCNTGESANEEAAFEEGIIDIMALEDPQNMLHSLNRLELSTMARASVTLERTRVQMLKGVFRVLTSAAGMSKKDVGVLDLLSYVTDMEEDRQARLNTHCSTETHTWAQDLERQCWQRRTVLRRREELHSIISEELEEAMTGETRTANRILHQYYTCQEQLEAGLDLFVANQRAALSERQAQRRFLVQGLKDLQLSVCDVFSVFSQHVHSWFTQIHREGVLSDQQCMEQLEFSQSELLHAKRTLEERLSRERGSAHCDMIKARRAHISEMVCEQKREQQDLMSVCEGRLDEYLLRWQTLLCAHNTQLSELITHLDREAAARMREVLLCALRDAAADLKQVECTICESLQEMGVPRRLLLQMRAGSVVGGAMAEAETQLAVREREAAKALRITRSRIHPIREQELREQRGRRAKTQTFCRSVCEGQPSLSERDLLRVQLECVKCECHLDRLLFPHTLSTKQRTGQTSDPTYGHALNALLSVTAHTQQACVCEDEAGVRSECEERVAMQVASLLWEKLERKNRVLDTHSALLTLHTMLLQSVTHGPAGDELAHTIHTHRLALEEAELQLQKEESEWEESVSGCGYDKLVSSHDGGMFRVDTECSVTECLRVALCKREQLAHNLSERLRMELRRQQVMEDLREQHELKRLYTHCDQDLLLTAVLVKLVGVSVPVLQQLLHLLLPTVPEGELESLIHTLVPNEGQTLDVSSDLVDTVRRDIISRNLSPCSQTHTDRMQKKKLKLQQKLFTPHPDDSTRPMTAAAEEDAPLVGGARSDEAGDTAGAVGAATEGERLFTVCPQPTGDKETADTSDPSHKHKKKRRFTLKKGTVAPLEQT